MRILNKTIRLQLDVRTRHSTWACPAHENHLHDQHSVRSCNFLLLMRTTQEFHELNCNFCVVALKRIASRFPGTRWYSFFRKIWTLMHFSVNPRDTYALGDWWRKIWLESQGFDTNIGVILRELAQILQYFYNLTMVTAIKSAFLLRWQLELCYELRCYDANATTAAAVLRYRYYDSTNLIVALNAHVLWID